MSCGSESSWAFIPQTFARCWWQPGECWVSCVVLDERKRERHEDQISSQVVRSVFCIFLEPTRHKETTVTPSFSSDQGCLSRLHICHFLHVPLSPYVSSYLCPLIYICSHKLIKESSPSPRETGGLCREDRYFLPS